MSSLPLISVVIPVYNGEKYIKACIENMLKQSYNNLEIIVVDDGSTDSSAKIAMGFPVRLIRHETNKGLSATRNTGIEHAAGEYIHFMDVDDSVNLDFYSNMAKAALDTGADIACSGIVNELKPHRTMVFDKTKILISTEEKLKFTNVGRWGYSVRYLFRKTLLNKHNLRFEEGRMIEDLPFSLSAVFFSKSMVLVPNAIYTYINRENSIMNRRDKAHYKKKHQDMRHAKELRHNFARKHKFKIPGVPTSRFALFFVKWFT